MVRPSEAAHATWDEIDFDGRIWNIRAERRKINRCHHIPLSPQVLVYLKQLKGMNKNSKFVFPSRCSYEKASNASVVDRAIKRMGYKDQLSSHGLRGIASFILNEIGFNCKLIDFQLDHREKNQLGKTYNRITNLNRRREMLEWWSNYIDECLTAGLKDTPVFLPSLQKECSTFKIR